MDNKNKVLKQDWDSRLFDIVNIILLLAFTAIIVIPVWNVVISSFTTGVTLVEGGSIFWPKDFSLENYQVVFSDKTIWRAFFISVARTVIGAGTHVLFCSMVAYGLSKRELKGRKVYSAMGIITMFFSGGMIPSFLLIRSLGLLNSFWVYIIPALFSYWNVIILMNFFRGIPDSLEEAAQIDGAGYWKIFGTIILPLSKAALATIALFTAVGHWNDFMTARLYITDRTLHPMQMRIYEIIVQSQTQAMQNTPIAMETSTRGLQLATIVVTTLPIVIVYPFLQKYFVSGMTLGAVKE